jgi:membrane protease YdiL (CAAX protease family)
MRERMMDNNQNHSTLKNYKKSLNYLFKLKNSRIVAKKVLEIGDEQKKLMNYDKAIEKYIVAYKLYHDEKNNSGEAVSLKSIGDVWKIENKYSEARNYYNQALNKFHIIGNHQMEIIILKLISSCYQAEGSLEDALKIHDKINELKLNINQSREKLQPLELVNSLQINKLRNKVDNIQPTRNQSIILIYYILIILFAQIMSTYYSTTWAILIESFLIISLIINSILTKSIKFSYLSQAMILLPLIMIISLNIVVIPIKPIYWLGIAAVTITVATIILMKNQNISRRKAGLITGSLPLQLIIALTGVALGIIEYNIIHPSALISNFNPINIIIAGSIIIISTGLLEELIFRGIIQKLAENIMGNFLGIIFASILFTILNISWNSPLNIIFIFLVSLYYGYVFQKTHSILGIGISQGLCNLTLFILLPLLL